MGRLAAPNLVAPPLAAAVWAVITVVAAAFGAQLSQALGLTPRGRAPRYLMALGLGYVALAYGVLLLGLARRLSPTALLVLLAGAALAGLRQLPAVLAALGQTGTRMVAVLRGSRYRFLYAAAVVWLALTFLAALGPSSARDWDGLSEHLAQAKTYLRHGRVEPLWYDHHSQFPATLVMLYCLALPFGGQGAAKLMHWGFGVLALLAMWQLARRHLRMEAGGPALWVLMTTPLFGWLATVGYVDLAAVFFAILTFDYALAWMQDRQAADLVRAGVVAGCGMTVKMQGLVTYGLLGLVVAAWGWRARAPWRPLLAYAILAPLVAAPWYVKSWVLTGNPVYPFAYGLFGGKQWSAEQARAYAWHHASFGYGGLAPEQWAKLSPWQQRFAGARHPWRLLLAPFTVTFFPEYYDPRQPRLTAMVMLSLGPMYLALAPLCWLGAPRPPPAARRLLAFFAVFWLWWLESAQLARYLLPWLTCAGALAGLGLAQRLRAPGLSAPAFATLAVLWTILALSFLGLHTLPVIKVTLGLQSPQAYLLAALDCYAPMQYLNLVAPPSAKVGTYGEPRVFYLDRDCIWADPGHSQLVNYPAVHRPEALVQEYRRLGLEYLLINQQFFGPLAGGPDELHKLLAQALQEGLLVLRRDFAGGKFLVLEIPP
jgi:hypothetical protein